MIRYTTVPSISIEEQEAMIKKLLNKITDPVENFNWNYYRKIYTAFEIQS